MSPTSLPSTKKRKTRWLFGCGSLLAVLVIVGIAGWVTLQRSVKNQVKTELEKLELGDTKIGTISLNSDGIIAHDLKFYRNPDDQTPWLSVDRFKIKNSISELIAGADQFDSIEMNSVRVAFDLDQSSENQIDIRGLVLPAKSVQIKDGSLVLRQSNKPDFVIDDLNVNLISKNETIEILGNIGALADGKWTIHGELTPAENEFKLALKTAGLHLKNGQWQDWPFLPSGIQSVVEADGELSGEISITSNHDNGYSISGNAAVDNFDIDFPTFDLPFKIRSGELEFRDQTLVYKNFTASSDGTDQWSLSGDTDLNQWPVRSTFATQFRDVSTATWRKLVTAIPEIISAETTGEGAGSVTIEKDLRTTLELIGKATSSQAHYDSIVAQAVNINVQINELVFDQKQNFETVLGSAIIEASSVDQPVQAVFDSFELAELNQQLEIVGVGSAEIYFRLPLETADDLTTWEMKIDGQMPVGSISGQSVSEVKVLAELTQGELLFRPVIATPVLTTLELSDLELNRDRHSKLNLDISWPIATRLSPQSGQLSVNGSGVPVVWLNRFLNRQIQISESSSAGKASPAAEISELNGIVDFTAVVTMPSDQPDQLDLWNAEGKIKNSSIVVRDHILSDIDATIRLADGLLYFNDLSGRFQLGGTIIGQGHIDIVNNVDHHVNLRSERLPVPWVVEVLRETNFQIEEKLTALNLPKSLLSNPVAGELSIEAEIQTQSGVNESPWSYTISIDSKEIELGPASVRNLIVHSAGDDRQLEIEALHAEFSEQGLVDAVGAWDFRANTGSGKIQWKAIPIALLTQLANYQSLNPTGKIDGNVNLKSRDIADAANESPITFDVDGTVSAADFSFGTIKVKPFGFDIVTQGDRLNIQNFRTADEILNLEMSAHVGLRSPFEFQVDGKLAELQLSNITGRASVIEEMGETTQLTGALSSDFQATGTLKTMAWNSSGQLLVASPTINGKKIDDVSAEWNLNASEWETSSLLIHAFEGTVKLVDLGTQPERVRVEISEMDAVQATSLFELPVNLSGKISGDASLNDWSLRETRWADINLTSSSLIIGPTDLGDFQVHAEYRSENLAYEVNGSLLAGKLTGTGSTKLNTESIYKTEFPFEIKLTNAALKRLYGESNFFRDLRPLEGEVSLAAKLALSLTESSTGTGRVSLNDLKWNNQLLSRDISVRLKLNKNELIFDDVKADLRRGTIAAQARWPLNQSVPGTYEIDIHQFDLKRIAEIISSDLDDVEGLLDARFNGKFARQITGRGYVGVDRASISGIAGQSFRLPVQYTVSAQDGSGKIELRRSTFRLFNGKASGTANIKFGSTLSIETDLKLTDVNTGKLLAAADFNQGDQGKMSGRLILKGNGIRSVKDLTGSFEGKLERANVFKLPVLKELSKFVAGNNIQSRDYDSDLINLRLNKGRVEVKSLNFFNSLVKVAITGDAFLDGRLDLRVAARVENLNQPTMIEQLAGSPLTRLSGSPALFFAQAADFLSDRVVFLVIGGTFKRPQIRLDSGQQLQEETIRYFLRGSQILPYDLRRKN